MPDNELQVDRLDFSSLPKLGLGVTEVAHCFFGGLKGFGREVRVGELSQGALQNRAQSFRPGLGMKPHRRSVVDDHNGTSRGDSLKLAEGGAGLHVMEGGADRDQVKPPESGRQCSKFGRAAPDPLDVLQALFTRRLLGLAEHVRLRVDSYGLLEERRELECQDARAAAQVQQATTTARAQLPKASNELSRVSPTEPRIETGGIPRERPLRIRNRVVGSHARNLEPCLRLLGGHSERWPKQEPTSSARHTRRHRLSPGVANQHFGNLGDVWKHIILAEAVAREQPSYYWETHAGSASYPLSHSPARDYGVHYLLEHVRQNSRLAHSAYFEELTQLQRDEDSPTYPGSALLAMRLLRGSAEYLLADLDVGPEQVGSGDRGLVAEG